MTTFLLRVPGRACVQPLPLALVAALLLAPFAARPVAQSATPATRPVSSPYVVFGFQMGDDGQLATWEEIERYFAEVAERSDRVELLKYGRSTEGRTMLAAIVSAPENIRRLEAIRTANLRLADPRSLTTDEAARLAADQKAIVVLGHSIHATEIGATQMANELLHKLATTDDPRWLNILRETVILVIPSMNPDGHALVTDWFARTKPTPFAGAPMPWLYHKYAGHDINRDAFMLQLAENRSFADLFYRMWHPHVFLTLHQMGPRGPRFFVPPNYDPIDPNSDPLVWRTAGLLGHAMAMALERENKAGVISNAMYDYYWPGYEDSAPIGHNTVCLLTEVASVRVANPIEIAPGDLQGTPRGLPEYKQQINFPNPWKGGTWRLRDIVDYELIAVDGLLDGVARYRREIVENFVTMGRRAVELGRAGGPYAFVVPQEQFDAQAAHTLEQLLIDGAVEVHRALEPFRAGNRDYPAGTDIVFMAQPFRAYAKTLLELQRYPVRKLAPNAPPERPYDVAGWTLPLQMNVDVHTIADAFEVPIMTKLDRATLTASQVWGERNPSYYIVEGKGNAVAQAVNRLRAAGLTPSWTLAPIDAQGYRYAAGSLVVPATKVSRPLIDRFARDLGLRSIGLKGKAPANVAPVGGARVGLHKPWVENIDEGWTRLLLERYEFPFTNVTDQQIRAGNLRAQFDVLVLPDAAPERLVDGHRPGALPAEYVGGIGTSGVEALKAFVNDGGTLVCLDSSCGLVLERFGLPVVDRARAPENSRLFCPGSLVRLSLDTSHPLGFGMPADTAALFAYGSAYELRAREPGSAVSAPAPGVTFVGKYGTGDPLLSGWLEGGDVIAGHGALADVTYGRGRLVLVGFRAQHRAQSYATFRVVFNALMRR
ncbi:MAG: peptidase M14 [Acidobacteria bacterium]|jgi:hypothetical protein|nr:peptidase M14 [Acidobacteriota bacterium]